MTTVKFKFKASNVENKEGTLYYQINHQETTKLINTNYKIYTEEWDIKSSKIILPHTIDKYTTDSRTLHLTTINDRIKFEKKLLLQIIKHQSNKTTNIPPLHNQSSTLFSYLLDTCHKLKEQSKIRTADTYLSTLNSFMIYRQGKDIKFKDINSEILEGYEAYLKQNNSTLNTISFYMRTLRAVYNRAKEKGYVNKELSFKRVFTSIEKTTKRAISPHYIAKLKNIDLNHYPELEFTRDIFLFSFYTRGMSFIDISYLRKKDIKNDTLTYRRIKTNQQLHIKWEKCMQEIVNKHPCHSTEFLLPIISNPTIGSRTQYLQGLRKINRNLKKIAEIAEMTGQLTMHVARHSWASIAKCNNIPISVISQGMGHDNETTTQIYLASLESSVIDDANMMIINTVLGR